VRQGEGRDYVLEEEIVTESACHSDGQQRTDSSFHFAPLHGVTDYIFRNIYFHRFPGFDTVLSPFILQLKKPRNTHNHFKDLLATHNAGIPLIPQLLGNDADNLIKTAGVLKAFGYREINLNLGCPFARIANKNRGSGLLPHPERIKNILEAVCGGLDIAVSVKLRLGRNDPKEILELMPIFNSLPLKNIIIHPRIGTQMYNGAVDLDGFASAAAASCHPVIYNGDIKNTATLYVMQHRFPKITGWMIGRAAVADPFLIGRIKTGECVSDPISKLMDFHDELYAGYCEIYGNPDFLLNKMKELWQYFGQSMPANKTELAAIFLVNNTSEYRTIIDRIRTRGIWTGLNGNISYM
jgi:tRNA-dihydrouridine synthase B